jgi:hypothetical protein
VDWRKHKIIYREALKGAQRDGLVPRERARSPGPDPRFGAGPHCPRRSHRARLPPKTSGCKRRSKMSLAALAHDPQLLLEGNGVLSAAGALLGPEAAASAAAAAAAAAASGIVDVEALQNLVAAQGKRRDAQALSSHQPPPCAKMPCTPTQSPPLLHHPFARPHCCLRRLRWRPAARFHRVRWSTHPGGCGVGYER